MTPEQTLFVRNLTRLKEQRGMTWLQIGQGIGHTNDRYVLALRAGKYEPRQVTIRSLAKLFDVPEAYFAEDHDGAS